MNRIILFLSLIAGSNLFAQSYAKDWHLQYSAKDTNYGIGLTEALKNHKAPANAEKVIVAVIDDGIDVEHPDLKENIWINEAEINGNAVDDDHNGYIDDYNGWDYLGSAGQDIQYDNLEITRLLRNYQKRFDGNTLKLSKTDKADYKKYKALQKEYDKAYLDAQNQLKQMQFYQKLCTTLIKELDSSNISIEDLIKHEPRSVESKLSKAFVLEVCQSANLSPQELFDGIREDYEHLYQRVNYHYNLKYDPRKNIGDNYEDVTTLGYGNNEVKGPDAMHGTHVAGIIAALRNNDLGMDGICPLVQVMVLRTVPNGDERDKDVAHAIRYAADNGARVINMSFGKSYSYNAQVVKDAILYAESKDVLMIHAAGNDAENTDKTDRFPSSVYFKDSFCKTWIEVGASDRDQQPASFSNYGKKTVDVFAPGVQIYSTIANKQYKALDGTSMASPVVAGLAALIRAYYPNLTAIQVKQVIETSVVKPEQKVKKPGYKKKKTKYKKLCRTAGIVNVEGALKAAKALSDSLAK
ncbi:MAG: S8 family serine peptidase [Bacteroidia bacterium]